MFKLLKEKWLDLYSRVDHFWWKNKTDIVYFIIFLIVCVINVIDYGK